MKNLIAITVVFYFVANKEIHCRVDLKHIESLIRAQTKKLNNMYVELRDLRVKFDQLEHEDSNNEIQAAEPHVVIEQAPTEMPVQAAMVPLYEKVHLEDVELTPSKIAFVNHTGHFMSGDQLFHKLEATKLRILKDPINLVYTIILEGGNEKFKRKMKDHKIPTAKAHNPYLQNFSSTDLTPEDIRLANSTLKILKIY